MTTMLVIGAEFGGSVAAIEPIEVVPCTSCGSSDLTFFGTGDSTAARCSDCGNVRKLDDVDERTLLDGTMRAWDRIISANQEPRTCSRCGGPWVESILARSSWNRRSCYRCVPPARWIAGGGP